MPLPERHHATAETFKPEFRDDVETTSLNGQKTPVNPVYCLTHRSALQLAEILHDLSPTIVQAFPYKVSGGVAINHEVPWFKFPSGCAVNAGTEANWWSNADGATAEKNCRADIKSAEAQYAAEGGGQYPSPLSD